MERDYFTEEQIEREVRDKRAEVRYIKRKILVELVVTTIFILYTGIPVAERFASYPFLFGPLFLNISTWLLWIWLVARRMFFPLLGRGDKWTESFTEEYRGISYYLNRLRRFESIFDTLIALQFLLMSVRQALIFFIR